MRRISLGPLILVISVLIISLSNGIGEARGKLIHAFADGAPDGTPGGSANIPNPLGVAVDSLGNVYVAASNQNKIFKIDVSGILTVVAGTGAPGFSGDGGPAPSAQLNSPVGVAVDMAGNLYIADEANHVVRMVNTGNTLITLPSGNIQPGNIATVAGTGTGGYNLDGIAATMAELNNPSGVALDSTGNLYIADQGNQRIRRVDAATGNISTTAGTGTAGYSQDGIAATTAELNSPSAVALDGWGNFYVADAGNQIIRVVSTQTGTTTIAGATIGSGNIATIAVLTHFEVSAPPTANVGSAANFTVSALDPNGSIVTGYSGTIHFISGDTSAVLPSDSVLTNGTATFPVTFGTAGTQTITATDVTTSLITGVSGQISVDSAPSFTSNTSAVFTAGTASSFSITTTGSPAPSLTETSPLPTGITFVDNGDGTGTLGGTPGPGTGEIYSLTFQATNSAGNVSENFTLTINEVASITSPAVATFTVGISGSFGSVASGYPAPSLALTGTLPAGLTFSAGTLSGTPAAGTGGIFSSLLITATNSVGSVSQPFTLTVVQPAVGSVNATAGTPQSALVNTTYESPFQVTVSDINGYPVKGSLVTFTVPSSGPSGAFAGGVNTATTNTQGVATAPSFTANGTGGSYTVNATVAGVSTPAAFSLTNTQAPLFTSANAATFTVGTQQSFSVTATGFPAPTVTESGSLPSGLSFSAGALSGTPLAGTGGTYSISFTASNSLSMATQTFTLTVNQAPAITSANAATFTVGTQQSFSVTATGFPSPTVTELGALPSGLSFSAGAISGTPLAGTGGTYSISFTASNSLSMATQTFTLTVNQAPAITSANAVTFTVGTQQSFSVTATGFPSPTVTESGALPSGLSFSAGALSGTPLAGTGGTYSISFTASNSLSMATQTFTLTVNQAPAITSANAVTFTVGTQQSFSVTATGFPSPTVTESGALPSGLSFSAGAISGTPLAGTGGTYTISFTASNSLSMATQTFTLTVNQAPAITSANAATFTVGTQQSFSVTATGFPAPTVTESGSLPSGLSFSAGALSGTPLAGTGGTYSISFTASNSSSTATQTFTLTVNQAPAITSANAATFTVGTQQSFSVTATGFPSPTVTELGALPSGLSFSAGALSGTPLAGTGGTYSISFTASNSLSMATQTFTLTVAIPPISVSIAPQNVMLYEGQSQQFTAPVQNTANQAVIWSIEPIAGNISTAGLYTAPSSITISQSVTVFATSMADNTKSATATVTLMPPVAVSIAPVNSVLSQGQVQQFTATVLNAPVTLAAASVATVPTVDYDNNRTGANLNEVVLTPANVASSLSRLGSFSVDGYIYAQPLFVGRVTLSDSSTHDLLIIATMNNTVFAFDANNPGSSALWSRNFGPTFSASSDGQLLYSPTGAGIVSTPVIDVANKLIYLVYATPSPSWVLAKLDLTTGNILGTSTITGQVTGTGDVGDPTSGTNLVFYPSYELQRPGLTLANGRVYIAFGSWDDARPEHGWIFAYDAGDLIQEGVLCLSPNSWGAPVWQSGGGLAADSSGNLYAATGNGAGTSDFSEAVVKMDLNLNIIDWYKPSDWVSMSLGDQDFSIRPMLVPGTNLLIAGAKDSNLYGLNPTNLGGLGGSAQVIKNLTDYGVRSGAIFNGSVYSGNGNIFANAINATTISSSATSSVNGYSQPITLSGSCSGSTNCILWATTVPKSAVTVPVTGTLRALNATTLTEIYNSDTAPMGADSLGDIAKFVAPVVINGHVYVATQDNMVQMYGVPLSVAPPPSNPTGTSVEWLITPNLGSISSAGVYTAPGTITTSQTITVTAISMADWTKAASATINLKSGAPQVPLTSILVAPANPTVNVGTNQQFTATGTYQNSSTQDISTQVTWSSSSTTVATINGSGLATGQTVGNSNITAALNGITSNSAILMVQAVPPPTCPCTIWSNSAVPAVVDSGAGGAVELGVKFRADSNGTITGIRFYKSSANTGTHVGNLWSSTGTLLATATFTSETGSGWQQVNFSTPVAITANTVYVASYHTNVSHFSLNLSAFATAGVDTPPLHALANGVSGGDGVYVYNSTSIFPTSTYSASNYWVDILFQ